MITPTLVIKDFVILTEDNKTKHKFEHHNYN